MTGKQKNILIVYGSCIFGYTAGVLSAIGYWYISCAIMFVLSYALRDIIDKMTTVD